MSEFQQDDDFTLHIELGNDAMRLPEHVAEMLRDVADRVETGSTAGLLRDHNGNTVGHFDMPEPQDEESA